MRENEGHSSDPNKTEWGPLSHRDASSQSPRQSPEALIGCSVKRLNNGP